MRIIPSHRAWLSFNFLNLSSGVKSKTIQEEFTEFQIELLKETLIGATIEWKNTLAGGKIKASNHQQSLSLVGHPAKLIDIFFQVKLGWQIDYIFHGETDNIEFRYSESDVTIDELEDTVNSLIREPGIEWIGENEPNFKIIEEGWKATVINLKKK